MDKIAYKHPVEITPELRHKHIMEIVQEAYNDFKTVRSQGKPIGTNNNLQMKMKQKNWKKIPAGSKLHIQNSLKEFL